VICTAWLKFGGLFEIWVSIAIQVLSQVPIKSLAFEACNLIILPAVVRKNFAACAPERGEVVTCGPGADIGGVEGVSCGGIEGVEGGRVPEGVGVDGVSEPVLLSCDVVSGELKERNETLTQAKSEERGEEYFRVAEWLAGVKLVDGHDFAARLHGWVYQATITAIKWTEDLPNFLHLNRIQAVRFAICICTK
jgi:hypothetical protein